MFNSIRRRLIVSYLFLTLFTVATIGIVGIGLAQRYAARQERAFLYANAQAIARQAAQYVQTPGGEVALLRLTQSSAFLGDMDVRVFDNDDRLLAASAADPGATELTWLPRTDAGTGDGTGVGEPAPVLIFNLDIEQRATTASAPDSAPDSTPAWPTPRADPNRLRPRESGGAPSEDLPGSGSMTVRRTPSFWGHRLIFESRPGTMQNHHAQMLEDEMWESQMPNEAIPGRPTPLEVGGRLALARVASAPIVISTGESGTASNTPSAAENGTEYGYVTVSRAVSLQDEPLAALRRVFLIAAAGAIGLATVVGWAVSRGLTAPIQQLAHTAGRMQAGDLTARAPVQSADELGALARQFNRMADQLQSSFGALQQERDTLRRFVADASHELRTPMTALRTFTELLQGNAGNDAARRAEFLQESQAQLARLEWITRNLLDLSRLDAGVADLEMTPHDAAAWIESTTAAFQAQATAQQIELVTQIPETPLPITGDRARLEMALRNLIDNGLKFTPAGGRVEVGVEIENKSERETLQIWVQDSGPGIDAADLPHIFERFYRSPRGRKEGSGLGLAITQSIAQAHSGRVVVDSTPGAGSRFTLLLPTSPPAPDVPPA